MRAPRAGSSQPFLDVPQQCFEARHDLGLLSAKVVGASRQGWGKPVAGLHETRRIDGAGEAGQAVRHLADGFRVVRRQR